MDRVRTSFTWQYSGRRFEIPVERQGSGPCVLMLPALSSISTLDEMAPLRDLVARRYATVISDWPGFGLADRLAFDWNPAALGDYLDELIDEVARHPVATIAAGHAAGYLLAAARRRPGRAGRLILIAPTWRGPLPTMIGRPSALGQALARLGDVPVLGQALYRLNVNRPMVGVMAREHVYDDPSWLDASRLAAKMAVTRSRGARQGPIRFVTGGLDPMASREDFLATARAVTDPMLLIYGATAPRKSKLEMEALGTLPNVEVRVLEQGKLAMHEEWPEAVFEAMLPFLDAL